MNELNVLPFSQKGNTLSSFTTNVWSFSKGQMCDKVTWNMSTKTMWYFPTVRVALAMNPSFPGPGFHKYWHMLNVLYQQVLNIQSPAPPIWSFMVVWHFEPFISMLASELTVNLILSSSLQIFFSFKLVLFQVTEYNVFRLC